MKRTTTRPMPRPNMTAYFRGQIDQRVHGMMAGRMPERPAGVDRITGDVTSREIVVVMRDGTEHRWTGGQYAARKVNLCYAPLMPKPVKAAA